MYMSFQSRKIKLRVGGHIITITEIIFDVPKNQLNIINYLL